MPRYRLLMESAMVNGRDITGRCFIAWGLIAVFYMLQYVFRVMPNTFSSMIMEKFGVGAFAFGQFSALYYVGYTVAQIPLGMIMDKWGPKRVTPICVVLMVLGLIPLMFGPWYLVQLGRVMTGFGSAGAALSIFKVSNMYFGKRNAVMTAIALTIGLGGAVFGGAPVKSFVDDSGWDMFLLICIGVGLMIAVLTATALSHAEDNIPSGGSFMEMIKLVFFNKRVLTVGLLGGCMIGSIEGFADGWVTAFLVEVCRIDAATAATLPSVIFLSKGVGSCVLSWMLSRSFDGVKMIIYCGVGTVFAFVVLLTGECDSVVGVVALLALIGFCAGYRLLAIYKAIEYVGPSAVAFTTAVNNMIIMLSGYFFHTVIGAVVDSNWDGVITNGHAEYGVDVLVKSLLVVPVGALVGTMGFLILKAMENKKASASVGQ
ncbi:MFS transporter [Anaplasma platys]|nr:MFS transporter [Anaplasma platys]